ncbi:MAG: DUF86 domain-containing protein [Firmicutes bacterium]|nr:DUF86 domain-containing protein [Bacillota bacterium]
MDNLKDDLYYLERMRKDLAFIIQNMKDVSIVQFEQNVILQDSMMFRLIQISENSRKLSDVYKQDHPAIPWTAIYGLRNRIVHDYGNVNLQIVFDTLTQDISELFYIINRVLSDSDF